jgi:hypothetical protein
MAARSIVPAILTVWCTMETQSAYYIYYVKFLMCLQSQVDSRSMKVEEAVTEPAPQLSCPLCPLRFPSVHRVLPHIYLAHRRQLGRQAGVWGEVRLTCLVLPSGFLLPNPTKQSHWAVK